MRSTKRGRWFRGFSRNVFAFRYSRCVGRSKTKTVSIGRDIGRCTRDVSERFSRRDVSNRGTSRDVPTYSAVASANTIPVHLHVHTNSTPGIILTGMRVASRQTGVENAEELEEDRRRTRHGRARRCTLTNTECNVHTCSRLSRLSRNSLYRRVPFFFFFFRLHLTRQSTVSISVRVASSTSGD